MPRRADICEHFDSTLFRYFLRKRYKRHKTFAERIGVSFQIVYAWASGDKKPTWKRVIKIADIFNIPARQLLNKQGRKQLQKWEDHLIDYLMAPPELKHETKITLITDTGTHTEKKVERELKLTTKEAIELAEKLGYFEESVGDADEDHAVDENKRSEVEEELNKLLVGDSPDE